ncbi:hypothetical protein BGZ60DRAFT_6708 [Tricladium varicosporioides]|nr:hypothetical protein BGZ60DRAFT_6708 [Hymenoscyphus varicosporioides]
MAPRPAHICESCKSQQDIYQTRSAVQLISQKTAKNLPNSVYSPSIPESVEKSPKKRKSPVETEPPNIPLKQARLTKKNLKALEKMSSRSIGRGKLSRSSRSKKSKTLETNNSSETSRSSAKTVSTTGSDFVQLAHENGILKAAYSTAPNNIDALRYRLNIPRETASPTESEYEEIVYNIESHGNEQGRLLETHEMLKRPRKPYLRSFDQGLNNFPKDLGFNDGLSAPQPDFLEGLNANSLKPFPVRQQLGNAAIPIANNDMVLPHLAGEWKGPSGSLNLARAQAAYDGACMVYGRNTAISYLGDSDPANHAFVYTFTIDGTVVDTYAHHSSKLHGKVEYHQTLITSTTIQSYDDYKRGRRQLRNLQEHSRVLSKDLVDRLQEHWNKQQQTDEPDTAYSLSLSNAHFAEDKDDKFEENIEKTGQLQDEYTSQLSPSVQASRSQLDHIYHPYVSQTPDDDITVNIPQNLALDISDVSHLSAASNNIGEAADCVIVEPQSRRHSQRTRATVTAETKPPKKNKSKKGKSFKKRTS